MSLLASFFSLLALSERVRPASAASFFSLSAPEATVLLRSKSDELVMVRSFRWALVVCPVIRASAEVNAAADDRFPAPQLPEVCKRFKESSARIPD